MACGSGAGVRILMLSAEAAPAGIEGVADALSRRGWPVERTSPPAGPEAAAGLIARTARAVRRFRPTLAVVPVSALAGVAAFAVARIPFVVDGLTRRPSPSGNDAPTADPSSRWVPNRISCVALRAARAVMVDEWAVGRQWVEACGSLRISFVWPGLRLPDHPLAERPEALQALRLAPEQRMVGLIGPLDERTHLDLLMSTYRDRPGVGLVITGDGPKVDRVHAMSATARPSAPVVAVGPRGPATDLITAAAALVGVDLESPGPGDGALGFVAQGRRLVTTAGERATPLLDLYPPERRAIHVARAEEASLRCGLDAALEAEAALGPLPAADVAVARARLNADTWAERVADVVEACA